MKYIKKPIPIEAWEIEEWWFNTEIYNINNSIKDFDKNITLNHEDKSITIKTMEGDMTGKLGDFLIRGVFGEFYSCNKDVFKSTYDVYLDC